ncbi:uncharacterized protein [Palaemon carinicauda]|uniref:uncharacterized protein n=1 Tax=Palaemon carinicauda TaxID=392227 RepID=UPI0035B67BED
MLLPLSPHPVLSSPPLLLSLSHSHLPPPAPQHLEQQSHLPPYYPQHSANFQNTPPTPSPPPLPLTTFHFHPSPSLQFSRQPSLLSSPLSKTSSHSPHMTDPIPDPTSGQLPSPPHVPRAPPPPLSLHTLHTSPHYYSAATLQKPPPSLPPSPPLPHPITHRPSSRCPQQPSCHTHHSQS